MRRLKSCRGVRPEVTAGKGTFRGLRHFFGTRTSVSALPGNMNNLMVDILIWSFLIAIAFCVLQGIYDDE